MGNVGLVARNIGLLIVGVMVSFVGVVNMTGDVRTIKKYHRLRVRAEDIPKSRPYSTRHRKYPTAL